MFFHQQYVRCILPSSSHESIQSCDINQLIDSSTNISCLIHYPRIYPIITILAFLVEGPHHSSGLSVGWMRMQSPCRYGFNPIDIWTTAYTDPLRVQRILSHAILFESELRWTWVPPGHIPCWITFGYSSVVMWNSMWDVHPSTDPYRSVLIGESCTVVIEHFQSWRSWPLIMVSSDSVPFGQGCVPLHMGWSFLQWSSIMKRWQPWRSDMNHVWIISSVCLSDIVSMAAI